MKALVQEMRRLLAVAEEKSLKDLGPKLQRLLKTYDEKSGEAYEAEERSKDKKLSPVQNMRAAEEAWKAYEDLAKWARAASLEADKEGEYELMSDLDSKMVDAQNSAKEMKKLAASIKARPGVGGWKSPYVHD
jgi:hypothetical protein